MWFLRKRDTRKKMEDNKKRHVVRFRKTEGVSPSNVEGMVMLRTPIEVRVSGAKDAPRKVDLGLSCNVPLLLFTSPFARSQGFTLDVEGELVMPNVNITFDMLATSKATGDLQVRDAVVIAFPLLSDFDIETV